MAKILTLNFTTTPIAVDTYAGEIGESGAVMLKVFPQKNEDITYYGMFFTVEGGLLPSRTFDVDEDIEILLTEELTQQDHTDCQLFGINADKAIVDKSPVVRLYFGESLSGEVVVDPITGDTIYDEISELHTIADKLDMTKYYEKTEVDELLNDKQDKITDDNKLDYSLVDNTPEIYEKGEIDEMLADKIDGSTYLIDKAVIQGDISMNTEQINKTNQAVSANTQNIRINRESIALKENKLSEANQGDNIIITRENDVVKIAAKGGGGTTAPIEMVDGEDDDSYLIKETDLLYADYVAGKKLTYLGNNVIDFKKVTDETGDTYVWMFAVDEANSNGDITSIVYKSRYGFEGDTTINLSYVESANFMRMFTKSSAISTISETSTDDIPNATAVKTYVKSKAGSSYVISDSQPTDTTAIWVDTSDTSTDDTYAKKINYSTEEQDTGLTWIDGKKIYRKSYYSTSFTQSGAVSKCSIATDIVSLSNIISIDGSITNSDGNILPLNIQYVGDTGFRVSTWLNSSNIDIQVGNWVGASVYITIQYTKTEA